MPFDNQETDDLMTFTPGHEGLRKLAKLLRMQMPPGFKWSFMTVRVEKPDCGTAGCALGLAMTVWPEAAARIRVSASGYAVVDHGEDTAALFGMSVSDARRIFLSISDYSTRTRLFPTPEDVADKIEEYLASHD